MLSVVIWTCANVSFGKSPVGDWQAVVQDIPTGWQIIVVTSMTFPCVFESANERELVCRRLDRANEDEAEIQIRRERIHEIHVGKRQGANMLAGGAAGAGLNPWAATDSRCTRNFRLCSRFGRSLHRSAPRLRRPHLARKGDPP